MIELYFAPGACSFVPHVALEMVQAGTGTAFTPRMLKMAKGEHKTPEYLALNPNGQVPLLVVDGRPLSQIVAICDWLDRAHPKANLLPADPCKGVVGAGVVIERHGAAVSREVVGAQPGVVSENGK